MLLQRVRIPAHHPGSTKPRPAFKILELMALFDFLKTNNPAGPPPVEPVSSPEPGLFTRLKQRLVRTRASLGAGVADLLLGKKVIDAALMEELETRLLLADVGVEATQAIIKNLTARLARKELTDGEALQAALKQELTAILMPCAVPLLFDPARKPFVVLMIGVNGAGKTTTIGKLARRLMDQGHSVLLAAGDTFRAAAVEQLKVWGERNGAAVIAQGSGADAASVVYDAVQAAQARGVDVVIADTAGRLHTQSNLMEELKKIKRVMSKLDPAAPHETLLVIDAGNGQNALSQAVQFHQALGVTGMVLTKLDGTAKGGIIFAIAQRLALPIRYIGVGESGEDLRDFDATEFVAAILN